MQRTVQRIAVLRGDASLEIGSGHLGRLHALARCLCLLGWETRLVINGEAAGWLSLYPPPGGEGRGFPFLVLDGAARTCADTLLGASAGAPLLVLDHYGLGPEFEAACQAGGKFVCAIDDLVRHHSCDLLVDGNAGRTAADYRGRIPAGATLCTGSRWACLDPALFGLRRQRPADGHVPDRPGKILVFLGRSAPESVFAAVLGGIRLSPFARASLTVVCGHRVSPGQAGRHVQGLDAVIIPETDELFRLCLDADLAIGAGGVSALERAALGVPGVICTLAGNQVALAAALAASGAALVAGSTGKPGDVTPEGVAVALSCLESRESRRNMARRAARLVDGMGAARLALCLDRRLADGGF